MHKLSLGIGVHDSKNHFALFEQCGDVYKAMEDRVVIADVLAKFERSELCESEPDVRNVH